MKKAMYATLLSLISTIDTPEAEEARAELQAELDKGKAKADANRAVYADIHDKVMDALRVAGNPVSAQDLSDEIGIARGKIVYGLTNYWADEVVADKSGKTTLYTLKV